MADPTPIRGKSDLAYRELKRRILTLELAPGQMLHEPELTEALALGRTPVREAIQRLAAEKLVVARSRQTPYVAPILAQELAGIAEMRLVLEVPAARMAAERGTAGERARLRCACETFRRHATDDDRLGILAGDEAVHSLIATMSRNSFLVAHSDLLATFSRRVWFLSVHDARRDEAFIACHDELTRTICAGDVEAAGRAATDHVALFQARLGRLIAAIPAGSAGPIESSPYADNAA